MTPPIDDSPPPTDESRSTRRRFLRTAAGVTGAVGLAGCARLSRDPATPTGRPPETPSPPDEPVVYAGLLDSAELDAIKSQLRFGRDPWMSGYVAQIRDAERALGATPLSVVDDGSPSGVGEHRFATGADRTDYRAAIRMGTWIRDLALAYAFGDNDAYARKAIDLLVHWFLDPETRMYPSGQNFGATYFSIEVHITVPTMIYGASLVRSHPYWGEVDAEADGLREWIAAYLADLEGGRDADKYTGVIKNNIFAWWILARAVAAAYLDDRAALEAAFEDWRAGALDQVESNGLLEFERQREDGLEYSLYGLKALSLTAEVARHYDVDLYGYGRSDPEGPSALERVFSAYAEYVVSSDGWRWGLGEDGVTPAERMAGASTYELAHSTWPRSAFETAIESVGRPLYERRILGWVTLTHANRFALDLP
jgi:hypothetical protein